MSRPIPLDPCNPQTRRYLHEAVRFLPEDGPSIIKMITRARGGIHDTGRCLGVLPASFNPPTLAHQALIREATRTIAFDELLMILDQRAMDKELLDAPLEDRLLMLLAIFGEDTRISLAISNRGLFADKIEALQEIYPPDTGVYFIVGYDTIVRVLDPRYYGDRERALHMLFSQARFLVANRGDRDQRDLHELLQREENRSFALGVLSLQMPSSTAWVSSTIVRQRVVAGESVRGLVHPRVEEFIRKRGIYPRQPS